MRLWSLHPRLLDVRGLVALWREGLLAQAVLRGRTRGYRHHPQLARFQAHATPIAAIAAYLAVVAEEAAARGYAFDATKLASTPRQRARALRHQIAVTTGQVAYEWQHLLAKLARRDPPRHAAQAEQRRIAVHPLFVRTRGGIADFERVSERVPPQSDPPAQR